MTTFGVTHRRRGRMAAVAIGLFLMAAAGCASAAAPSPTSATPTALPVFASDEEALAAATEAYAKYQEIADEIDNDGGRDPERIASIVSDRFFPSAVHQSDGFLESNLRSVGTTTFLVHGIQKMRNAGSDAVVSLYICDDVSATDVIDESGASQVSESRDPVTPFEVSFVLDRDGDFVVDSREVWEGEDFC